MPQLAPVTLNGTVFTPADITRDGIGILHCVPVSGNRALAKSLTMQGRKLQVPGSTAGRKGRIALTHPVIRDVAGVDTSVDINLFTLESRLAGVSTLAERQALVDEAIEVFTTWAASVLRDGDAVY